VRAWRDDPALEESADFDPVALGEARANKSRLHLERFEKPRELAE